MTSVSAPPREAPFRPGDFRRLWKLAEGWGATYRYRPAAAELDAALREIDAERTRGPDYLEATVHGNSVPEMREAAITEAQKLYGPKAVLEVVSIDTVNTTRMEPRTRFYTRIRVRCLNYAEVSS